MALNNTTTMGEFSALMRFSKPLMTTAGVITIITMVVGVIGNLLTVVALLRHSKLRTVAAAFIASLCVSDLLFCFFVLPFGASQFFHGTWIHGKTLCVLVPLMRYGSGGVSLLGIAMISINRYILIAWPSVYPRVYTKLKVIIYVAVIWVFSYGLQIPTLLGLWGTFGYDDRLGTCTISKDKNGRSSKTAMFVIGFVLPCIVIIVCYSKIYWVVRASHKRVSKHSTGVNTKRSEMKITKMVLVIFLCFVVCYLPLTVAKIFDSDVHNTPFLVLGYILFYTAACINPVVYVTMNKQYRQAYFNTLRCGGSTNIDSSSPVHHSKSIMSVMFMRNAVSLNPNKS